ncbi:unnamed protein product [Rhodiola kirilowii]
MASSGTLENRSEEEETHLDDLEELESEVNAMARKIMEYRSSLPEQLKSRFASLIEAQRPVIKLPDFLPGPSDGNVGEGENFDGFGVAGFRRVAICWFVE